MPFRAECLRFMFRQCAIALRTKQAWPRLGYFSAIQSRAAGSERPLRGAERTARKVYRTRNEAKADVFDYIERFYNPKRRHSTIGYLSPVEYEKQMQLA
jgi:transposase InsO family protein